MSGISSTTDHTIGDWDLLGFQGHTEYWWCHWCIFCGTSCARLVIYPHVNVVHVKSEGCTVESSMTLCWIAFQVCSMKIIVGARRAEAWVGSVVLVMTLSGQQMAMYNLLLFFVYTRINS
jgi:hypothetical protein